MTYLSRVHLRRNNGLAAIAPILIPSKADERINVSHRLVWAAFGEAPDQDRDFLWREERPGQFIVLSQRKPLDPNPLFEIETRCFDPEFQTGQRLAFRMKVNATTSTKRDDGYGNLKEYRHDVVMHAISNVPKGQRNQPRKAQLGWDDATLPDGAPTPAAPRALRDWLVRQGQARGFDVGDLAVMSYNTQRLGRDAPRRKGGKGKEIRLGTADLDGTLTISDPTLFHQAVINGFGRAKAFGCGLMLIKQLGG